MLPRTLRGSGTSTMVAVRLRFDPLGRREDSRDVVESLESKDKEDDRVLKPGLCKAEGGPRLLCRRGAGEYDLFALPGGGVPVEAGVECPDSRSSHISPSSSWHQDRFSA
ncbi:hypothetical protein HYFRA_00002490 [Hymenoscyphus fraxineus]|uniref:Uncharacterized protein n=1 Tax=Hymenoscyphus fraxineus TaxID=746836 RepID=A0A9N9PV48_9HELO|nr:hypothetical protein HYFRA_00002490 [Hymenoscyphus fraxineus]